METLKCYKEAFLFGQFIYLVTDLWITWRMNWSQWKIQNRMTNNDFNLEVLNIFLNT